MWVRRFESSSGYRFDALDVNGAALPVLALAMAPLMAANGAGVSETRRGKTEAAISRALLPIVTVGPTVDMEAVLGGTAVVGEIPAPTAPGITPGDGLVAAEGLAAEACATAAVAAAVILTIAAAADAGTCALKRPEMDSGEDGGVKVCTDWPVLATNFKGYGSIGKVGRAACGITTLLPFLSLLHTLIVLPVVTLLEETPLLLLTTVVIPLFVISWVVVMVVLLG